MIHPRTLEDDSVLPHSGSENLKKDYGTIVDSSLKAKRIQSLRFYRPHGQGKLSVRLVFHECRCPEGPRRQGKL